MHRVLFILLAVVLAWDEITTSASSDHQLVAEGVGNGVMMKCIDKERHALVDFKANLQDRYDVLSRWGVGEEEEDCCRWSGVYCNNQTGHVTELHLGASGLEGEISPSLLNLTYLAHLDLAINYFKGTIPDFIGSLTHLRYLSLAGNSFNGTIPNSIGSLTELRYLSLDLNYFHGTIPESIGSLTQLSSLQLSDNSFNGTIPRFIGSLIELRSLYLSNNSFTGTIPPEFGNLTNLEYLSLGSDYGSLATEKLDWLSHLSQLKYLDMDGTSLAKANNWVNVIISLQKLSTLSLADCDLSKVMHPYYSPSLSVNSSSSSSSSSIVSLYLEINNLNSSMYHWLFPLTSNKLDTLSLSGNMLDGIPKYLGNLCSLRGLYLRRNSVVVNFSDFLNNLSGCTSLALQDLDASVSQFTGSLSDDIQKFSSLKSLNVSYNQLNGSISEKLWELPKLQILDLSSNPLKGHTSQNIRNSNLSDVQDIDLSSCKQLGPHFPKWIQQLKNLTRLNIANTMISDTIPTEFWNMWPSRLIYLNLSSNNITGKVPNLISNFNPKFSRIDLSSNDFYGPIPNVPSTLNTLDLSNNKFSGGISLLCQIVAGFLTYLDLSNNSLTGQIPDCLWHFKNLKLLNLGHNYLSGRLPASVESMFELEGLYLNNNVLSGELPMSLKNCTKLTFLDLGTNMFSGILPHWIGENLSMLYVIILTTNRFFGSITLGLCQLENLQILDLSMNNLNGTIPSCLNNLTAMVKDGFSHNQKIHNYEWRGTFTDGITYKQKSGYIDSAMIKWQGSVREFSRTLGLLKIIDLSSNNITGQIPYEVADLNQLFALNLSKNSLQGKIPQKIGQMKELQVLDLSRNNLSGELPSSMSQIHFLNYLDVSYNNLSGRIPTSTQLQSFEPSWYTGNAGLCGPPVTKNCTRDEEFQVPPTINETVGDREVEDDLERWFYIGGGSGFAAGFWIVCSALLLNRRGRHAFFSFLDNLRDWVYVKVMVFIAKFERVAHA